MKKKKNNDRELKKSCKKFLFKSFLLNAIKVLIMECLTIEIDSNRLG